MLAIQKQTANPVHQKATEYVVTLVSLETDDQGAGFARTVAVSVDPGIRPDWNYWLDHYCELEGVRYSVLDISEIGLDEEF
jgi:hypothetical protein